MKITHLKKGVAAWGIALFFTFGALAVSLAYEAVPAGPFYSGELHYLLGVGTGPLYTSVVAAGFQFETAYLTESPRLCSQAQHVTNTGFAELLMPFHVPRGHPAKVSLQILKSALLL